MRRAVCPGSFDPVHNGHVEVIARATSLFDEVIVAVSTNYSKTYRFSLDDRIAMISETVSYLQGITVVPMEDGLVAEFCRREGASALIKGLRNGSDLDYEMPMAAFNRHLTGVETVFLPTDGRYSHVSSSLIKEISSLGGDVSEFVPRAASRRLETPDAG